MLLHAKQYKDAALAFERALDLGSKGPHAVAGLGNARIGEGRWADAAELLGRAIAGGFESGFIHGQLALAQLQLGRNAEAVASYEKAFAMGIPPSAGTRGIAWYNLACAYTRVGRKDDALTALGRAVDEGFVQRANYESDPDLAPLRSDPRFAALLARMPATSGS